MGIERRNWVIFGPSEGVTWRFWEVAAGMRWNKSSVERILVRKMNVDFLLGILFRRCILCVAHFDKFFVCIYIYAENVDTRIQS